MDVIADNTILNTGTGGDTISTDDLGTVKVQRVKVQYGTDGSATDVSTSNPLPISDGGGSLTVDDGAGSLTVDGTVTANLAAGTNNIGDVDVLTMPGTAADGGTQPATTVVVSGNDGTSVQTLKTDVNGILQTAVNGTVAVTDNSGSLTVDDGGLTLSVDDGGGSLTVDGTVGVSGTVTVDSELTTADLDTGAGTDTRAVVGLALAASGGAVLAGTANPIPISDNSGSLTVDGTVTANAGTGPWPVTDNGGSLTVDNAGTFAVQIAANSSVNQAQIAGTTTDTNSGVKSAGTQRVVLATDQPQLTNALKVDGSAVTQPVSGTVTANAGTGTFATSLSTLPALVTGSALVGRVNVEPQTANGLTPSVTISAASTNATSVKASAGQVYSIFASNTNAAVRYLKLYNKASAPTVGTDTPVLVFAIPGNAAGAGFSWSTDMGVAFGTGVAFAITTGVANSDTGAVAANELVVNLLYK